MVYQVFSHRNIVSTDKLVGKPKLRLNLKRESFLAILFLNLISGLLFIYDLLSYPIYFVVQRPDRRSREAANLRSEQVDAITWVKQPVEKVKRYKFRGTRLDEIFAHAIEEFSSSPCLGYRAVITCPILSQNDRGHSVLQEKSFRSDYTWYTYEQIGRRVQDIASGLYHHHVFPGTRCLFLASSSLEWFCASQACFQIGAEIVLAPEISCDVALYQILRDAEVGTIFTSCDRIAQICSLFECIRSSSSVSPVCQLTNVIIIDWLFSIDFTEPAFAELRRSSEGVLDRILSLGQIEETGVERPIELNCTNSFADNDTEVKERLENTNIRLIDILKQKFDRNRRPSQRRSFHAYSSSSFHDSNHTSNSFIHKSSCSKTLRRQMSRYENLSTLAGHETNLSAGYIAHGRHVAKLVEDLPSDNLAMIVYKYGKLGQLKAVSLTHNYLARSNYHLFLDGKLANSETVHCASLDLDNALEFMTEMAVISNGGSIGYSCNQRTLFYDGKDLFERDKSDLEALNATSLLLRPYQIERLRGSVQNYLNLEHNSLASFLLLNLLCSYRKYWARKYFDTPIVNRVFCAPLKKLFGTSLRFILCNGVTDCSETKDFFAFVVGIPVIELYGPTEADVCATSALDDDWSNCSGTLRLIEQSLKSRKLTEQDDEIEDTEDYKNMQLLPPKVNRNTFKSNNSKNLIATSIFRPTFGTRIRLEDWEDFRHTDQPYPRGRLVIGGQTVCNGYFMADPQGRSRFYRDSNGLTWFRSDEIARFFPNGCFEIISAMSDIIKMGDGQLISLSQIEHSLRNSQFVDNVCAICVDERRFVIVFVVPNLRRLALKSPNEANLKMAIGSDPEPDELIDVEFRREVCNDRLLCEFVADHLTGLLSRAGFQTVQSRFHLVPEIWTPESELVTPSFEPKRTEIQNYYASDIKSILGMQFLSSRMRLSARIGQRQRKSPMAIRGANPNQLQVANRLSY